MEPHILQFPVFEKPREKKKDRGSPERHAPEPNVTQNLGITEK